MEVRIYTVITRSGLHCGVGQGLSDIDLPTAKDSVSGYPFIPGSSVKGVLRDWFRGGEDENKFLAAFGQEPEESNPGFASAVSISDADLICLPVRSYFGTFAYLASPYSLARLGEHYRWAGQNDMPSMPVFAAASSGGRAAVPEGTKLLTGAVSGAGANRVLLEDLDLIVEREMSELAGLWADRVAGAVFPDDESARQHFRARFLIVDDNIMAFLCSTALPVAPHIRIDAKTGIVRDGALWWEEFVPAEAIFAGKVLGENGKGEKNKKFSATDLLDFVCAESLNCQIGGNATTGRGLVSLNFSS